MTLDRRTFVRGIGTGLATLTVVGTTSADGRERYVVTARGETAASAIESAGFEAERSLADGTVRVVRGPEDAADDLAAVRGTQAVMRDRRLRFDRAERAVSAADAPSEPAFYDALLWDKQRIDSLEANEVATGAGTTVAIIDTGIDHEQPELSANLDADAGRLFREGTVRDGVGEVLVPDDYEEPTELTTAQHHVAADQEGHGTHAAGIAAAADGDGVVGTAPDATLVPLRVFWWTALEDPETGETEPALSTTTADILTAIDYAASAEVDAANLSLGTAPIHPREMRDEGIRTMRTAYRRVVDHAVRQGTVVVSSAGNDETDLGRRGLLSLPNSVQGALSVSATGPADELASYSDYGTSEIDVGAPGGGYETERETLCGIAEWIEAGRPIPPLEDDPREPGTETRVCFDENGDVALDEDDAAECHPCTIPEWPYPFNLVYSTTSERIEGSPYGWKAGTSMAAPQVAGLVALVRELEPDAKPNRVESAIKHGAEGAPGRGDPERGAGRINARRTVERLE